MGNSVFPEGKFMATVKVGAKGQIVIPAEVREMLHIRPGDTLLLLADVQEGIALPEQKRAKEAYRSISEGLKGGGEA